MHFAGLLEAGNELFYVNHLEECLAHGKSHISVSYKNNNYYFSVCCLHDSNPASLPALTPTPHTSTFPCWVLGLHLYPYWASLTSLQDSPGMGSLSTGQG